MKKLFALKKIGVEEMQEEDGGKTYFAYTKDLVKKGLMIKFYETGRFNEKGMFETAAFILAYDNERSYSYMLFSEQGFMEPLLIYSMIVDAVEFIQSCDSKTVLKDIEDICTEHSTSDDAVDRAGFYKSEVQKINMALVFIRAKTGFSIVGQKYRNFQSNVKAKRDARSHFI